ncbi:triose-phosphate isomerase [Patescibacteria group bacterium]|nr:MAG: triose-phosphate isomerase [Patescibacteria group bacterium]
MKQIYLFANWKMYLDFDESNILANALAGEAEKFPTNVKMTVFPSALSLYSAGQVLRDAGIGVGAQNVYWVDKGGYTGEVSAQMFQAAGCEYALVGHSERRHQFGESNHEVRQKLEAILAAGLTPVLCVGETAKEREEGKTEEVLEIQLRAALQNLAWPKEDERPLFIAYEPVWAIGTGNACDDTEACAVAHNFIDKLAVELLPAAAVIILYGGSVRPENIAGYLKCENVSGVLVGGASAKLETWLDIAKNAVLPLPAPPLIKGREK